MRKQNRNLLWTNLGWWKLPTIKYWMRKICKTTSYMMKILQTRIMTTYWMWPPLFTNIDEIRLPNKLKILQCANSSQIKFTLNLMQSSSVRISAFGNHKQAYCNMSWHKEESCMYEMLEHNAIWAIVLQSDLLSPSALSMISCIGWLSIGGASKW